MDAKSSIYVAGSDTMIGAALSRRLAARSFRNLITEPEPDLTDRSAVERFFQRTEPEVVFVVAGKSAGIGGNLKAPADLMLDNLLSSAHLISAAWSAGTKALLYLASSCIYPKQAPQPFAVSSLW